MHASSSSALRTLRSRISMLRGSSTADVSLRACCGWLCCGTDAPLLARVASGGLHSALVATVPTIPTVPMLSLLGAPVDTLPGDINCQISPCSDKCSCEPQSAEEPRVHGGPAPDSHGSAHVGELML